MRFWYCAQTDYQQEFEAQKRIEDQGFETWCPSFMGTSRKKPMRRALFGSYLFVKFHPRVDHWQPLYYTRGVKRLFMSSPTVPAAIPTRHMAALRLELDRVAAEAATLEDQEVFAIVPATSIPTSKEVEKDRPILKAEQEVKITNGPLSLFHGIVTWTDQERVRVLYSIFGRQAEADLSVNDVKAI